MIVIPGFAHHVTKHLHVALPVRSVHHLTVSFPCGSTLRAPPSPASLRPDPVTHTLIPSVDHAQSGIGIWLHPVLLCGPGHASSCL